jgi:septum formation protein
MRLLLASASPRRAELLASAGMAFDVAPADVDETAHPDEPPRAYAMRVARDKAQLIARSRGKGPPVLAADTVVVAGGRILGKPADLDDARQMLGTLSGSVHEVHTAVVFLMNGRETGEIVTTRVRFVTLSESEMTWYLGTGEPFGKAGGYAIQGQASRFIDWIEGSWSNVVGLPVATVYRILKGAGMLC